LLSQHFSVGCVSNATCSLPLPLHLLHYTTLHYTPAQMPPKAKGKKKSKAELEAERLLIEAEDAFANEALVRKAAEDALKDVEDLKLLKASQVIFRQDELSRLKASYDDNVYNVMARKERLALNRKQEDEKREWEDYTTNTSRPGITESELNTYISTMGTDKAEKKDDLAEEGVLSLLDSLEIMDNTEDIVDELNGEIAIKKGAVEVDAKKIAMLER
jgi:hypothetical protein